MRKAYATISDQLCLSVCLYPLLEYQLKVILTPLMACTQRHMHVNTQTQHA